MANSEATFYPIIIVLDDLYSDFSRWATHLQERLADHPLYRVDLIFAVQPYLEVAHHKMLQYEKGVVITHNSFEWIQPYLASNNQLKAIAIAHKRNPASWYRRVKEYQKLFSHVILLGQGEGMPLKQYLPTLANAITTLPYSVPMVAPSVKRSGPFQILLDLQIPPQKLPALAYVFETLEANHIDFHLDLLDPSRHLAINESFWQRVENNQFRLLERKERWQLTYANYDVFIFCDTFVETSLPQLEAMAHGVVPISLSDDYVPNMLLDPGVNGFELFLNRMDLLVHQLQLLASDRKILRQVGENARSTAQHIPFDRHLAQLIALFDQCRTSDSAAIIPTVAPQNQSPKVTFVLPDGPTLGGVTTWTLEMAKRLNQEDFASKVLAHRPSGAYQSIPLSPEQQHHIIDCHGPNVNQANESVIQQHYLPLYDQMLPTIFVPNFGPNVYATLANLAATQADQMRVIGYAHTDEDYYYNILKYYDPIISSYVAVSSEIGDHLKKMLPHRAQDVYVKPYGVMLDTPLNRTYSPPSQPIQLVYAGRIAQKQKNIFAFYELLQALDRQQVNFQISFYGQGPDEAAFRKKLEQLPQRIFQRVLLKGTTSPQQMLQVWQQSDLCVLVSDYEGTSIAMLEAMGGGCVPVVSRVSGTQRVISDGQNGFSIGLGATLISEMAACIAHLEKNRHELIPLGKIAHQTVLDQYSYEQYLVWFKSLLSQIEQTPGRSWNKNHSIWMPKS